jgi:hypothetical protein
VNAPAIRLRGGPAELRPETTAPEQTVAAVDVH